MAQGRLGISLAKRLQSHGIHCTIFEAGGYDYSDDSQAHYQGDVVGDPYFDLDTARLRMFGGSSNHWAGWCRTLDDFDFDKDFGPNAPSWPIARSDLVPYLKEACSILDVVDNFADEELSSDVRVLRYQFSPPTLFGEKFEPIFRGDGGCDLVLNAYVTHLVSDQQKIGHAVVKSAEGEEWRVSADYFVVCTGGIENSRLLLWSNEVSNNGVVPQHRQLGKLLDGTSACRGCRRHLADPTG